MNEHRDDIPITDYAFGELPDEQRNEIEQALSEDPSMQSELAGLLETAKSLEAEFHAEIKVADGLDKPRRSAIDRKLEKLAALHHRRKNRPAHWRGWMLFLPMILIGIVLILIILMWYLLTG